MAKNLQQKLVKLPVWLLVPLLISSCGFQLRGGDNWPREKTPVFVESNERRSLLVERITRDLQARNVQRSSIADGAKVVISVLDETFDERPLTVGVDGRVREYEVSYIVRYGGRNEEGLLLEPETFVLSRIYAFDPNAILASQREVQELEDDLRKEASLRVLTRFARLPVSAVVNPAK